MKRYDDIAGLRRKAREGKIRANSNGWVSLGGKSRKYVNIETGEELSRRQYDERIGRLKEKGFKTPEQQAKATPKELREQRPARGRPATTPQAKKRVEEKARKMKRHPAGRDFSRVKKPKRGAHRFYEVSPTREAIADFIWSIKKNRAVFAVGIPNLILSCENGDSVYSNRVMSSTALDELPDPLTIYEMVHATVELHYACKNPIVHSVNFNVVFKFYGTH